MNGTKQNWIFLNFCIVFVCIEKFDGFCVCAFCAGPPSPAGPLLQTPLPGDPSLRWTPLCWTAQNFALFSLSRHYFPSFFLSWGLLVEFWWLLCTFGVLRLSCETPAAFAKCQEQFHNRFAPPLTSKKVNNQLLQILLASRKKKSPEHNRNSTGRRPPTFGTHTSWPSLFLGCCLCCLCCS